MSQTSFQEKYPATTILIMSDQTLQERKRESALMRVEWALIQSGVDRKSIKVRSLSIYVKKSIV